MDKELIKRIIDKMPEERFLGDIEPIIINGVKYGVQEEEELTTEDEGKYQYGGNIYAVGLLDEEKGYDIKGEPLFYVEQNFTQCGSYFEFQERTYEKPYQVEKKEVKRYEWFTVK